MGELPEAWALSPLIDLVQFNPGIDKSAFQPNDEIPFVPMPAVEALTGRIDTSERRSFEKVKSGFTAFASGDVLFAKITPCMENGKMAIVPELPDGIGFGTTEFHVLRPTEALDERLLYYFVSSAELRHEAQHQMAGAVGQKRVPKRFLEKKIFPLPPLNEQRRIVEKIEALFAELDKGEEALRKVQALLKRYRQSVLKAAVTGELTADWRAENAETLDHGSDLLARILETRRKNWTGRGKYKEPVAPDTTDLPDLPDGWVWVSVDQIASAVDYGTSAKCTADDVGVPVLRMGNIVNGELDTQDLKFLPTDHVEFPRLLLEDGDLLFNRTNSAELVGKTAVYRNQPVRCSFASYLIRVQLIYAVPELVSAFINSAFGRDWIRSVVSQQVGQANVNGSKLKALSVPMPSLIEQLEIVSRLNECFSRIAATESWCETELARSGALRQSILKDAFAGRLVPQDPDDEPASELLARIRAERAAEPKKAVRKAPQKKTSRKKAS